MKTYNVTWNLTGATTDAGANDLARNAADMPLQEICDLAVEHDANATLHDVAGFTVGHVSKSGTWNFC